MRIDAFNQVSQLYKANGTKKTEKAGAAMGSDRVEISQIGRDYQIAQQAVSATPDIRTERVEEIRAAIASGTYNVSSEEVADRMVESYFDTNI